MKEWQMSRPGIDWDAQPLGEVPDKDLALLLNVQPQTVGTARRKRDIPSALARQATPKPAQRTPWGRNTLFDPADHRGDNAPDPALDMSDVYSLLG